MLLVESRLTRVELPQDGARLDPANPLARRFVTAYLPGVLASNLGFGAPGALASSAFARAAIPAGPELSIAGSGASVSADRTFGPTPSYPLTMVVVCRQYNNTTSQIASLTSTSPPAGSLWYISGASTTTVSVFGRNNFSATLSLGVTVPADAAGNQAINQDLVIVAQSISATDHRLCVNSSAIVTSTTNIGSLVAWDRLMLGQTSGNTGVDVAAVLFAEGGAALTDAQMRQIASSPRQVWALFEPHRLWTPVASAPSGPTLSAATAIDITSTTARPRVSITF